jgi:hypothetical protein
VTKQKFISSFGDPALFTFKGQCYDAGQLTLINRPRSCDICGHRMREVYVVYNGAGLKYHIGYSCLKYFQQWNPPLHETLQASHLWLQSSMKAETFDRKRATSRSTASLAERRWKALRRSALQLVRKYRTKTGKDWLPEPLFNLKQCAALERPTFKRLSSYGRWFQEQTQLMERELKRAQKL